MSKGWQAVILACRANGRCYFVIKDNRAPLESVNTRLVLLA
jgi:hypothetical protein